MIIIIVQIRLIPLFLCTRSNQVAGLSEPEMLRACPSDLRVMLFVLNIFTRNLFTTKSSELISDLFRRQASTPYISVGIHFFVLTA